MSEQRCGTCRWFSSDRNRNEAEARRANWSGYCNWRQPVLLPVSMMRLAVDGNIDGEECPCYERKERDDLERHAAECAGGMVECP